MMLVITCSQTVFSKAPQPEKFSRGEKDGAYFLAQSLGVHPNELEYVQVKCSFPSLPPGACIPSDGKVCSLQLQNA